MRILVVGAGATGGFFGARLVRADRDVTFLVRPGRAAVLRERGLRITGLGEDEVLEPNLVTAAELAEPYDLVLLSVKATALERALDDLAPAVGPRTVIVPFLNGMAHLDTLSTKFGKESVLGGVVKVMTTVNGDGDIVRLGPLGELLIGEPDGGTSPRTEELAKELDVAGYDFTLSPDILAEMWHKWAFIASLAAATCLMRGSVGDIVAVAGGAEFGRAIAAEAAAVVAAAGFPLAAKALAATTSLLTQEGSPATASMYRDLVTGQPAEVEQILGDLVSRARELSVDTPLLDVATLHLRVHERRAAA
ncbi:MAG TPA: 2-dehydropantoate 2-reductase [Amycolatopsis sp.]|nr:2-dehydropantoate 2-reductase [Amycolatopsis sp.]